MTAAFFSKAQGAIVVFDVSDLDSFEHLSQWIDDIQKVLLCVSVLGVSNTHGLYQSAPEDCSILLCANKTDLPPERWQVSRDTFEGFAQSCRLPIIETSASSGKNINQATLLFLIFYYILLLFFFIIIIISLLNNIEMTVY